MNEVEALTSEFGNNTGANDGTPVTVTNASTAIVAANASRQEVLIQNNGTAIVYIGLGITPIAATTYHVALSAASGAGAGDGGSIHLNNWNGAINGITASGSSAVSILELTSRGI